MLTYRKEKRTISKPKFNFHMTIGKWAIVGVILVLISTILSCITPLKNLPSFNIWPLLIFGWGAGGILFLVCGVVWIFEVVDDY